MSKKLFEETTCEIRDLLGVAETQHFYGLHDEANNTIGTIKELLEKTVSTGSEGGCTGCGCGGCEK